MKKNGLIIAIRHYDDRDPRTGREFDLQDVLIQKRSNCFELHKAGATPEDPLSIVKLTLREVFAWFADCPFQIEHVVYTDSLS